MGSVSNSYNESDGLLLNRTCKEPMPLLPSVRFHAGSPGMHAFPLPRSLARHETPQASNNTQTTPSGNYRIQPNMSTEYCTTTVLTGSISRQYNKEFTRRECGGYLLLYLILTCLYRLHPNALQTVPPPGIDPGISPCFPSSRSPSGRLHLVESACSAILATTMGYYHP